MSIRESIRNLFLNHRELSAKEITDTLSVSKQMVHLVLKDLVNEDFIEKLGRPPKTIYRIKSPADPVLELPDIVDLSEEEKNYLNDFLLITETGDLIEGLQAFAFWCKRRGLPIEKTILEFVRTKQKYEGYYDDKGMIDGMDKLKNTKGYDTIWLNNLYYLDFYAIERFGKTRLGTLLHFAKQGQNKFLMSIMLNDIFERIREFVSSHEVDAVGFVPPTIRREIQLMKFLQNRLKIPLPILEIKKLSGIIPVPQKSLSKLDERIRNADKTFAVTDLRHFNHVLLIDDAVGSGSTLNQIARKIKVKNISQMVTGLAIVGSFKGFDVITDV